MKKRRETGTEEKGAEGETVTYFHNPSALIDIFDFLPKEGGDSEAIFRETGEKFTGVELRHVPPCEVEVFGGQKRMCPIIILWNRRIILMLRGA